MKKLILTMVLAGLSHSAMAEWTRIYINNDNSVWYVELATIKKNGDLVRMWVLRDDDPITKQNNMASIKTEDEYNCRKKTYRSIINFVGYSGNIGSGDVIRKFNADADFEPIEPGTLSETHWQYACGIIKP